jgi:hypothetical protein
VLLLSLTAALAQAPVTVIGAVTPGNCVSFFSPVQIKDSGAVCGGGSGGSGTVTSVALALPVSTFSISGSPVTVSGTLTGTFVNQNANTVFAGPTSGGAGVPTWRALVAADIPGGGGTVGPGSGGTGLLNPTAHSLLQTQGASNMTLITAATAGRMLIDQGAGIDWAPKAITGDVTFTAAGAATVGSFNGGSPFGSLAGANAATPPALGSTSPNSATFTSITATSLTVNGPASTTDLTISGPITVKVRVTTTSPVTISNTTDYLICNRQAGSTATTINLPPSPNIGDTYLVKDCKGDDATNNITVTPAGSDAIDAGTGGASYVMKNSSAAATPIFFDRAAFTWSGNATIGWIVN